MNLDDNLEDDLDDPEEDTDDREKEREDHYRDADDEEYHAAERTGRRSSKLRCSEERRKQPKRYR